MKCFLCDRVLTVYGDPEALDFDDPAFQLHRAHVRHIAWHEGFQWGFEAAEAVEKNRKLSAYVDWVFKTSRSLGSRIP